MVSGPVVLLLRREGRGLTIAMLTDYSHTGAPTLPDLRHEFYWDHQRDIIDAPDFLPCGGHFVATSLDDGQPVPTAAHAVRPGAFR